MSPSGLTCILSHRQPATGTHWQRPENRRRGDDPDVHTARPGSPHCVRSEGFAEDLPEGIPKDLPLLPAR